MAPVYRQDSVVWITVLTNWQWPDLRMPFNKVLMSHSGVQGRSSFLALSLLTGRLINTRLLDMHQRTCPLLSTLHWYQIQLPRDGDKCEWAIFPDMLQGVYSACSNPQLLDYSYRPSALMRDYHVTLLIPCTLLQLQYRSYGTYSIYLKTVDELL